MKKALLALASITMSASVFAQGTTGGDVIFKNRGIIESDGVTTYNTPIFAAGQTGNLATGGAGKLPGGVTVGLFLSSNLTTPLATAQLATTPDAATPFFASQDVVVPGTTPGQVVNFTIREWQTAAGSFAAAQSGNFQWAEQTLQSQPLGGTPTTGTPVPTPTLTGWGNINGSGITLTPEPSTIALGALGIGALLIRRRK